MSMDARRGRLSWALRFGRRLQRSVVRHLKTNITTSRGQDGEVFSALWADSAVFPNGERSDRAGGIPLIETGALLASVKPGRAILVGDRKIIFLIDARDYGLRQHKGLLAESNEVGRTLAVRRRMRTAGGFAADADLRAGDVVKLRKLPMIPPRRWIAVGKAEAERMAHECLRR